MMFDALDRTMKAKGNRLAYLRDLFYSRQKAERFSFAPIRITLAESNARKGC